jgi:hypothetical protein
MSEQEAKHILDSHVWLFDYVKAISSSTHALKEVRGTIHKESTVKPEHNSFIKANHIPMHLEQANGFLFRIVKA